MVSVFPVPEVIMLLVIAVLCLLWCGVGSASAAERIESVVSRSGVSVPLYLQIPDNASTVFLLFPGGKAQHFQERKGRIQLSKNFLCRVAPQWVKKGFAIAIQGVPSDQGNAFSDEYRTSREQREDFDAIVHRLAALGYQNVYLVATSRGTLSAAAVAAGGKYASVKGLILTATLEGPRFLRWVKLEEISYPTLFVHHRNDGCRITSVEQARESSRRLKSSPKVDFVELDGGYPPQSDACEALSEHGFFGVEDYAADAIVRWVESQPKQQH